ncbi:hypothetical protein NQ318_000394 [Aromia moschata]|uniref:BRCT domain-containing protein n=1 Tax=Aromia moschata TaxID=1265417 RepID=A0AAV8YVJ3_9CUCU|nr:hypothetical protein NQ318_000394 [Aromia moschata]
MENIRLIFVLAEKYTNENEASEIMIQAFEACKQNVKTDVTWLKEKSFDSANINKTDFVIFEDFKGNIFDRLKETKCARILGPWAISICLMEGKAIPNFPWPIYNVAMYDCIVTSSNLSKSIKMEIKEKVQIMGGCYVDNLVEKVTHLVTDNPKSEKYLAAAEAGVALMCSSWIEAVWVASQAANVHCRNKEFEKHRCLPFQNLIICCTGLAGARERKELEKLITENGGQYSAKLNLKKTDFLVCSGVAGATSEKYKAARKTDIKCVDICWALESVRKGYALPHNQYPVKKCTSTPTKTEVHVDPDFSTISAIGIPNTSQRAYIEESVAGGATLQCFGSPSKAGPSKRKGNLKEEYGELVDKLDIKKAKMAGHYLDGCSVYVTGFSPAHTEKLCKILNLSGATRYDQFSDRVTHVIVGDPKYPEVKTIKNRGYHCLLVSVQWVLESIEKEQPVNEENYLVSSSDLEKSTIGSPLSKKGLSLLRSNVTITENRLEEVKEKEDANVQNPDDDILQQYLKPANTVQEEDTLAQLLQNADNTDFSKQVHDLPKVPCEFKPSETSTQQTNTTNEYTTDSRTEMFLKDLSFLLSALMITISST